MRTATIAAALAFLPAFFLGATTNAPYVPAAKHHAWAVFHKGDDDGGSTFAGCQQPAAVARTWYRNNFPSYFADNSGAWLVPATAVFQGSRSSTTLTVTAVDAGTIGVGMVVTGTGWVNTCDDDNPYVFITANLDAGALGTGNWQVSASGTIASAWLTGTYTNRFIYDGGTGKHFKIWNAQSYECHSGIIMVYNVVRKNGVDLKETMTQAYIPNSNPVMDVSFGGFIHVDPGDYIETAYAIDKGNEHYDVWHSSLILEQAE